MRKLIDGLFLIVSMQSDLDVIDESMYIFINQACNIYTIKRNVILNIPFSIYLYALTQFSIHTFAFARSRSTVDS